MLVHGCVETERVRRPQVETCTRSHGIVVQHGRWIRQYRAASAGSLLAARVTARKVVNGTCEWMTATRWSRRVPRK